MKIIVKNPGQNPHYEWTDNTLEALQKIVGGYIEVVTLAPDLALICNEEAGSTDSRSTAISAASLLSARSLRSASTAKSLRMSRSP